MWRGGLTIVYWLNIYLIINPVQYKFDGSCLVLLLEWIGKRITKVIPPTSMSFTAVDITHGVVVGCWQSLASVVPTRTNNCYRPYMASVHDIVSTYEWNANTLFSWKCKYYCFHALSLSLRVIRRWGNMPHCPRFPINQQ